MLCAMLRCWRYILPIFLASMLCGDLVFAASNTTLSEDSALMCIMPNAPLHPSISLPASWQQLTASKHRSGGSGGQTHDSSSSESTLAITLASLTKNFNDPAFSLSPISNSAGSFTFVSSDTKVATIAGNTVTLLGGGTATVTVTQAAAGHFPSGSTTATLTVRNYCQVNAPCLNGGSCSPDSGVPGGPLNYFTCSCPAHFGGETCTDTDVNCRLGGGVGECENGGTCEPNSTGGACACAMCYKGATCGEYDDVACPLE